MKSGLKSLMENNPPNKEVEKSLDFVPDNFDQNCCPGKYFIFSVSSANIPTCASKFILLSFLSQIQDTALNLQFIS